MTQSPLIQVLALLRPYWRRVLLALLLSVLTIGSSIALMMTSAWLISSAALQLGITSLGVAPTGVRLFGLSRAVFRYLERLVSHDVTFRLLARLRVWFYARLEPLSLELAESGVSTGDLMSRVVNDVEELQNFYLRVLSPPLVAILVTLGTVAAFAFIDRPAALILLFFMVGTGLLLPTLTWWRGRLAGRQVVIGRTQLNRGLIDLVQGLADSLAFGYAPKQRADLFEKGDALAKDERRLGRLDGLQSGIGLLMVHLAMAAVLWSAIGRVDGILLGTLALGTVAAFEALTPLGVMGEHLSKARASAEQIFDVIDRTPSVPEPTLSIPSPTGPLDLDFERISFRYREDSPAVLSDFSLHIPQGQKVLITGESGCGKSTLINLLLRFVSPTQGKIRLGSADITDLPHETLRAQFGVMGQQSHLFNTTILENIRIGDKAAQEEGIYAAAKAAQIDQFIAQLPNGYATEVGESGNLVSGGERQRIALARMLLKGAPIWVMDEMTANLDPLTATAVLDTVFELAEAEDRTLIMITHRSDLVERYRFDQVIDLTSVATGLSPSPQ